MTDAQDLIGSLLTHLTFPKANIIVEEGEADVQIDIQVSEDSSGMLIGYRGEKINALQLLCSLILNHNVIAYRHVHIDINGYRQRRQQSLHEMADSAANSATSSGREILLPPLSSYERRLVHLHLQDNPQVETYSEGELDQRRLVVRPVSEDHGSKKPNQET